MEEGNTRHRRGVNRMISVREGAGGKGLARRIGGVFVYVFVFMEYTTLHKDL